MNRHHGFTMIELMIVIAIIAIVAGIFVPNLIAARESANQTAAIATLRNLVSAEAQFQQGAKADEDGDGSGEYGGFLELSGAAAGRMARPLVPSVLSGAFSRLSAGSVLVRQGFVFQLYLPQPNGAGMVEDAQNGFTVGGGQDPDLSEAVWCCYAWPLNYSATHGRTFFVNQAGDILWTDVPAYSGTAAGPAPDAAYPAAGEITGEPDIGGPGHNPGGQTWRQVQ